MDSQPVGYRQATLSQLRPLYKSNSTPWTNESLRVMPEPQDNFLSDTEREAVLMSEYLAEQKLAESTKTQDSPITEQPKTSAPEVPADVSHHQDPHAPLMMSQDINLPELAPSLEVSATPLEEIKSQMGVSTEQVKLSADQKATVGTFNIEWLGTKKRSNEDYKAIAEVIKDTGAAVLGIQEISSPDGLKKVLQHLPDFGFILGKSNNQMVGVIFDKDRVSYDPTSIDQLDKVSLRPPLTVDMKVDNFDFNFTVVHLKARFDDKAIAQRGQQTKEINKWLSNRLETKSDKDAIIVGDYNDFIGSQALNNIAKGGIVQYATEDAEKNGIYSNIKYTSVIDHAALTSVEGGATEEFIAGSTRTVNENNYQGYLERISDHKPIVFDVKSDIDND